VIPNSEHMRQYGRRCVGFFLHPDGDFVIRCLDGSNTYEPTTDDEHFAKRERDTVLY